MSTEPGRERAGQGGAIWDPVGPGPSPSPRAHLQPAFGGRGIGARLSSPPTAQPTSSSSRELKYRARRQADEPSFQIRDYVESQKNYQKNKFDMDPRLVRKINEQLGFYFEHYGYPMREV